MKSILTLQTRVTTQTVLASTLLRLPVAELEEAVRRELAENPALELVEQAPIRKRTRVERSPAFEDGGDWENSGNLKAANTWDGFDQEPFERLAWTQSPRDQLLSQARLNAPDDVLEVVCCLVHALDEHGFLRLAEEELARNLGVACEHIGEGIAWLQKLDPPGIGARDLRECFLLQCAYLAARGIDCSLVVTILDSAWDSFSEQQWGAAARKARISPQELEVAIRFMRENLYPYPLSLVDGAPERGVALSHPDLIIHHLADGDGAAFFVEVAAAGRYRLRVAAAHQLAVKPAREGTTRLAAEEREWAENAVERARRFIDAAEQRSETLRRIGQFVVEQQHDFFAHGPSHLKPLTRAAVAKALGVHESTVSRAVSDKVVQLPSRRLIELSNLFDGSLAAKEAIRRLIQTTGKPLSDRQIAEQLEEQSLCISRRTVAKYRAELGIMAMGQRQGALD
jgi:RNA polymerase sigma-54 factor